MLGLREERVERTQSGLWLSARPLFALRARGLAVKKDGVYKDIFLGLACSLFPVHLPAVSLFLPTPTLSLSLPIIYLFLSQLLHLSLSTTPCTAGYRCPAKSMSVYVLSLGVAGSLRGMMPSPRWLIHPSTGRRSALGCSDPPAARKAVPPPASEVTAGSLLCPGCLPRPGSCGC